MHIEPGEDALVPPSAASTRHAAVTHFPTPVASAEPLIYAGLPEELGFFGERTVPASVGGSLRCPFPPEADTTHPV